MQAPFFVGRAPGEAIAKIADGAGVDIGALEPVGRQYFKLRMHEGASRQNFASF